MAEPNAPRAPTTGNTICAVATPPGAGGLGIVRVSGPAVPAICKALIGRNPAPRMATLARFRDADDSVIDSGIVLYFPAPHSFTGEDVLELQGHGGAYVLRRVLQRVLELGARGARPGEFSERAFLNDKIDLVQAEAIADLIESGTDAAARAAQRSLQGVFSRRVRDLQETLTGLRVFVEAAIDFPDEEIDFLAESDVVERTARAQQSLRDLLAGARQGRLLRDGIVLAIVGRPNAGKSSLLNALSGQDSAIVTEIPGTTRDVLREMIDLDGIPVHVADTAGIRETEDIIEAEGVRRARAALAEADIVLLVEDARAVEDEVAGLHRELPEHATVIRVGNKIDLLGPDADFTPTPGREWISAKTGQGLDGLRARIREAVGATDQAEGNFSARQRHVDALKRAGIHLETGRREMEYSGSGELLAEELRLAQAALGEITGELLPDDLLGEIFSSFCIGK
ncbi:MAG: tRNA uridine-5-carboxymethylaminomethyl(34) synthesis GTPase MnmE [Xanthomonadales bacterium]|nr:tRNA uridine-5-carboxymethylaminomethyl(34) synthesis GTPase MnmE [Gammaproteobacteria bacterium]MBT8050935.1 tRNA uridine-5-carboxymethylaminomethyl(34) synthesis GTPase MnmE [Gammaproteobacteria bacterium]MBT8057291.1 tRNA uridine-5-carboxymethylaminomethyl(34) synthesis GTPase MnmE [Gammaproteobacteria bacterium]NNJ78655.1 tRNA uridine-5-carboxymethylaminomethyl(34) synthesis GTPase MnmE [Xanthomonadales bacterium]NNL04960.1 tRNA uridine-5-carboxymethylaminomethyl(34) synthesis GTPase Mnm